MNSLILFFLLTTILITNVKSSWTQQKSLPFKRSDFTTSFVDPYIYLAGGCIANQKYPPGGFPYCPEITDKLTRFDPDTLEFYQTLPNLPQKRYRHTAATVGKKIYFIGGLNTTDGLILQTDVFNTVTNTWNSPANYALPTGRSDLTSFVIGSQIYLVGGYNENFESLGSVLKLDVSLQDSVWESDVVKNISGHRGDACAVNIDGKGYVFGGFTSDNGFCDPLDDLEIYSPIENEWKAGPSDDLFTTKRGDKSCAVLNNKLYVIGGEKKDNCGLFSIPVIDVESYDVDTNEWSRAEDIPFGIFRSSAIGTKDKLWVFGGQKKVIEEGGETIHPILDEVFEFSESSLASVFTPITFTSLLIISFNLVLFLI